MIAIQTDLAHSGIIRHIQELFRHIQTYFKPCVTLAYLGTWYLQNSGIFRTRSLFKTLVYSQPWCNSEPRYILNAGICKTRGIFRTLQTSTIKRFAKIVNGYNYFCSISLMCSLLHEANINLF